MHTTIRRFASAVIVSCCAVAAAAPPASAQGGGNPAAGAALPAGAASSASSAPPDGATAGTPGGVITAAPGGAAAGAPGGVITAAPGGAAAGAPGGVITAAPGGAAAGAPGGVITPAPGPTIAPAPTPSLTVGSQGGAITPAPTAPPNAAAATAPGSVPPGSPAVAAASGASAAQLLAEATQSFNKGDYAAAAATYEAATTTGLVNGHLFYDLGIATFRAGHLGDAVAAFLAARRYLPRDPDVAANLRFVLAGIHDKLEPEMPKSLTGRMAFWLERVTVRELAVATATLFGLLGIALTLAALLPALARARRPLLLALVVPLALGAALVGKSRADETWGAVRAQTAKVYSGPGVHNTVVFELQEGAPVLVTEVASGGFARIELSDGKKGWIPDSDVRVFGTL